MDPEDGSTKFLRNVEQPFSERHTVSDPRRLEHSSKQLQEPQTSQRKFLFLLLFIYDKLHMKYLMKLFRFQTGG